MALLEKIKRRLRYVSGRQSALPEAKQRLLSSGDLTVGEKAILERVSLQLHPADTMYDDDAYHYLRVGLNASRLIRSALDRKEDQSTISSILDFPSGYGRVLRFIRAIYPEAEITAAELEPAALKFCRRAFSVDTFLSHTSFSTLSVPKQFDLIWCGSLFTHIDKRAAVDLLRFFGNQLSDQGVCVFTTHGQYPAESLISQKNTYGLSAGAQKKVAHEFESQGYGYANYPKVTDYGVSAVSHDCLLELAENVGEWRNILFAARGWDNHQDVYAFAKQKA